jgi:hypothetical protein
MEQNTGNRQWPFLFLVGILIMLSSCEKEKIESPRETANEEFYLLMKDWYLWNTTLPEINPGDYGSPVDMLEDLRYKELDRWSYVTTVEEFTAYYEQAAYTGYGFGHATDEAGNRRITFVFNESPLKDIGVERGWILQEIDGELITPETNLNAVLDEAAAFTFLNPDGEPVTQTFAAKEMTMNTVLLSEVIEMSDRKVGHLVFKSFLGPSEQELENAFEAFQTAGVTELILDLRYNGGGQMDIATLLAGLIIPESLDGNVFATYEHNDKKKEENYNYLMKAHPLSLNLETLYVITSGNSASASEALVNGLSPFIQVVSIGTQSYGKPVGMYAFYQDTDYYAYVPVTFKISNSEGYGEYYDGLPVAMEVADDITRAFDDPQEACLHQALHYIEFGSFDPAKHVPVGTRPKKPLYNSIESIRGAL